MDLRGVLSKPQTLVCETIGLSLTVTSLTAMDVSGYQGSEQACTCLGTGLLKAEIT